MVNRGANVMYPAGYIAKFGGNIYIFFSHRTMSRRINRIFALLSPVGTQSDPESEGEDEVVLESDPQEESTIIMGTPCCYGG